MRHSSFSAEETLLLGPQQQTLYRCLLEEVLTGEPGKTEGEAGWETGRSHVSVQPQAKWSQGEHGGVSPGDGLAGSCTCQLLAKGIGDALSSHVLQADKVGRSLNESCC